MIERTVYAIIWKRGRLWRASVFCLMKNGRTAVDTIDVRDRSRAVGFISGYIV